MTRACVVVENHPTVVMGGAQYQGHLLAAELAGRAGVQVTYLARDVAAREGTIAPGYRLQNIGNSAGIRRRAVVFDARQLWHTLQELHPDVIYQQMRQSYTAVCARYAAHAGIPFFFQVASDIDLDPRWMRGRVSGNLPFDLCETVLGAWGLRRASHVIAQTGRQGRLLRERFGLAPAAVIRNFQPLPAQLPGKPDAPLEVFWVANFKQVKRPELFVQLAQHFAGRRDLRFTMAGRPSAPRDFAPLLEKIRSVPNLQYLGELPVEAVNERMAGAAMHVNTSSYEGFPNTFIQAWARGAVVASLAVDPDEEGMEALGIGYCAGSFDRLCALIDELARSGERRRAIAERAFAFAHARHSLSQGALLADMMLQAAGNARRAPQPTSAPG
ncbi:MAG TPA: glycosyltransferase family 4 protein [Steroidobacteraceae bacterium]|nr:glycosyltransferase family 4 protein [Steroidobacteraceae bacterium]